MGLLYDHVMTMHAWKGHPECPERISLLNTTLQERGLQQRCVALQARQVRSLAAWLDHCCRLDFSAPA